MPAQYANKATGMVGTDGWNPVAHIKKVSETMRVVIPVADKAERDGLAALFPGGVIPVGTTACRLDRKASLEPWDGTKWVPGPLGLLSKVRNAGANVVGVALNNMLETTVAVEANREIEVRATIDGRPSMDAMFVGYTIAYGGAFPLGTFARTASMRYTTTNLGEAIEVTANITTGAAGNLRFGLQAQVTIPSTGAQTMTADIGNTGLTVRDIGPA